MKKPVHMVFIWHILTIQIDKQGQHVFKRRNAHKQCDISHFVIWNQERSEEVLDLKHEISQKNTPKIHFGVTKKDPGSLFHFHVLNLFKCWSKLGLTKFEMSIEN